MQFQPPSDLRDPAVVIAFEGWNDAANAASDTVSLLDKRYPSRIIGRIDDERYYDFQAVRPEVRRAADGPWIVWPHTSLIHVEHPDRDLILAIGPEPSLLWRSYCAEFVRSIEQVSPSMVVLLGAMLSDTPHSRPLPVSTYSLDKPLQDRLLLNPPTYEGPTGILGVLNQAIITTGIPVASIWVQVPHYVATPPNPKAQLALLAQLEPVLGITLDKHDLPETAEEWTRAVDELSQEDPDVAEYIEQLEEQKDASDVEGATGDTIAAEFERYLRGRGGSNGRT